MKKILIALGALCLAACASLPISPTQAPAPLAQTTIDDAGLSAVWKSFDTLLDAVDLAIDAKAITPGSARAVALANGIDKAKAALQAAEHAAAAGSATSYKVALAEAKAAFDGIRSTLRSK